MKLFYREIRARMGIQGNHTLDEQRGPLKAEGLIMKDRSVEKQPLRDEISISCGGQAPLGSARDSSHLPSLLSVLSLMEPYTLVLLKH